MLLIFAFLFRAVFKSGFIPATFFSHLAAVPKPIRNTHLPITNSAHINSWCAWGTCEKNTANPKRAVNPPYLYPSPPSLGHPSRADRVFSWRQWASGAAAVWNAANCDAEQTALRFRTPPPALTATAGKDEPRFCEHPSHPPRLQPDRVWN